MLNKVDLPAADPDKVMQQIEDLIGLDACEAILTSAKTGRMFQEELEAVVKECRRPRPTRGGAKALLFDCWFDAYLGVVVLFRVVDGLLKKGDRIR